jgi:hypothetical protein
VLFSAAWPGQTGTNHINEQWHDYWVKLFANAGFVPIDWIRPLIMKYKSIPSYYRSNILFFIDKKFLSNLDLSNADFSRGDWRTLQEFYHDRHLAMGLFQRIGKKLDKNIYLTHLKRLMKKIFLD